MPLDSDLLLESEELHYLSSPLATCSKIIPGFRPRPHQKLVSDAIVAAQTKTGPRFIAVSVPPQYGKSTVTSIGAPLWWLELHSLGVVPGGLVGIVSYEDGLAMSWSKQVRETIDTQPDEFYTQLRKDSRGAGFWETKTEPGRAAGGIIAVGISGTIVGRPISLLILDDVTKNEEQAASEKHRETVWNFWQSVGVGRLQPWTIVIATGTRWREDDLIGRLTSKNWPGDPDKWNYIRIPAVSEDSESDPDALGRPLGEPLLRPQAEQSIEEATRELIEVKNSISTYHWHTIWQQNPVDPEGTIFFESKWRYWGGDVPVSERYDLPAEFHQMVTSWDMSFRDTKGTDWVVGSLWGRVDMDFYLLELIRGHWGFSETCTQVINFAKSSRIRHPKATTILVEGKANGDAVMNHLRSTVGGLIDFDPSDYGSKLGRAWATQPYLVGGNMYAPAPSERPWVRDYTKELADFPNAAHDDMVDSTTQAVLYMQKYHFEESTVASPEDLDAMTFQTRFSSTRQGGILS